MSDRGKQTDRPLWTFLDHETHMAAKRTTGGDEMSDKGIETNRRAVEKLDDRQNGVSIGMAYTEMRRLAMHLACELDARDQAAKQTAGHECRCAGDGKAVRRLERLKYAEQAVAKATKQPHEIVARQMLYRAVRQIVAVMMEDGE